MPFARSPIASGRRSERSTCRSTNLQPTRRASASPWRRSTDRGEPRWRRTIAVPSGFQERITPVTTEPYLVISSDTHAGLPTEQYRPYVDPDMRQAFDDMLAERAAASSRTSNEFAERWLEE